MKFQITRVRLACVGPEPARFDPLQLDFRNPDGTGPSETVLFLPNTGGKTVLMRLLFTVLHPPIVDRIGTEETAKQQKNLLGYVLERDTSHVVIEWRRVEDGRFADDEVLLTGVVAEWRGGRPTGKPADLNSTWYSIRGPAEQVGIDRLEFDVAVTTDTGSSRHRLPLRGYKERLDELEKRGASRRIEVTTTEVQRDWVDHLDQLGLDRALFRYQGEMNHNEAGASTIARFREDRDFIKFFLDAVFDPAELSALDREFEEVADKVKRLPEYEKRLQFEQSALAELDPLVGLVARLAESRVEVQRARSAALDLLVAFSGAETLARSREGVARERARELDLENRKLVAAADKLRDEVRELRRLGAILWRDETRGKLGKADERVRSAEVDVRAWSLTEDLSRFDAAVAKVKVLDQAYAAETERLRPLQEARDSAATALVQSLAADAVIASNEAELAKARVKEAQERAAAKRNEERDSHVEAAKLDAARSANEQRLDAAAALRGRLVTRGLLASDERAEAARERETALAARSADRLDAIDAESSALNEERGELDRVDQESTPRLTELGAAQSRVSGEIRRAETQRNELVANPLVVELAETRVFDLELVGPAIADRLLSRARDADAERLTLEVQGAEDRRAMTSLKETGLLPPPPEVQGVLDRLAAAGVTGAMAGTRYVADAIAADKRIGVLRARPDLVGGVVLTQTRDVTVARSVLEAASLEPTMVIAVGAAEEVVAAERAEATAGAFVVPPSNAVWDRGAAVVETGRRNLRLESLQNRREELDRRISDARALANALVQHAASYPPGWLSAQVAERESIAAELGRMKQEREERKRRRDEIAFRLKGLHDESIEARKAVRLAEQRASELQRLVEEEVATAELPALIDRQRTDAKNWRAVADEAAGAARRADEAADAERAAARDHARAVERLEEEIADIALREPVAGPDLPRAREIAAQRGDLAELRERFLELDRRLSGETSASEAAARLAAAIQARDQLATSLAPHPPEVKTRAKALLASPEAGTSGGRRSAAQRADSEADQARIAARDAFVEHDKAKEDLSKVEDEIRTSRRTAKIPEQRAPHDRHHAAVLAAEAQQAADNTQAQAATAERERNGARDEAESAKRLGDVLTGLLTQLRIPLKLTADAQLPNVPAFEGTVERANAVGLSTAQRLTEATSAERDAEAAWHRRDNAVRALLAQPEFADLASADHLYRRLARSTDEALARDAADLVAELRTCIGVLKTDLATLEEDRKLATTSLAKSVNKALSFLRLAETRSKMPPRLRDWSGEPFFDIRFERPPADELDVRLRTFVAEILDPRANRPSGSKLLMYGLERAVGEFRVKILKPNEAFAPIRVPVAELSSPTFSNGQRATVATAMMLMLSELRRQSRSVARDASVGTLLLDNPLGNANAGFLIDVQRTVAAAAGIQLIYTTGIADLNALRRFSLVVALSNDAARRTMRRYVRANPALLDLLVPAESGPGGRLTAHRVVALENHGG